LGVLRQRQRLPHRRRKCACLVHMAHDTRLTTRVLGVRRDRGGRRSLAPPLSGVNRQDEKQIREMFPIGHDDL
jgi:hypothetical protein